MLSMTVVTPDAQKAMLKPAVLEIFLELFVYIRRQISFLSFELLLERRVVLVNELIEESPLRAVAHIEPYTNAQAGFPANG